MTFIRARHVRLIIAVTSASGGATENARLENPGPAKMQGWKTRDHLTGVENARPVTMERQSYQ